MGLKRMIEDKGFKQKEFAEMVGASPATVCMWVNGKAYPRPDKLLKMEELLGVSAGDIIRAINER